MTHAASALLPVRFLDRSAAVHGDKTAVIDDWHTAMAMVLLKLGITDVNTSSADDLKKVGDTMITDWAKQAGPDGQAVLGAYRK